MEQSALLIMDVQVGIVARYGGEALLERLAVAVRAARRASVPVIFVRVGFRPGFPEVSSRNRAFQALRQSTESAAGMGEGDTATMVHPDVGPEPGDLVVVKRRVSAFSGSDLAVILGAGRIGHLVLSGIATSGVVLSTVREAADRDFELTVLRDGCLDADPEVHRVLMEKVFPRQAAVVSVDEWVAGL